MAKLKFNSVGVAGAKKYAISAKNTSDTVKDGITSIQNNMQSCVSGRNNISVRLTNVKKSVSQVEKDILEIYQMIDNATIKYTNTEGQVVKFGQAVAQAYKEKARGTNQRAFAPTIAARNKAVGSLKKKFNAKNGLKFFRTVVDNAENRNSGLKSRFESCGHFIPMKGPSGISGSRFNITPIYKASGSASNVNKKNQEEKNIYSVSVSDFDDNRSGIAKFVGNDLKASASVLSGEILGAGELWGINTAGKVSGAILTGEAGIKSEASLGFDEEGEWDVKSFGLTTSAYATGALAKGTVEGNVGYLHGNASGQFLTGTVKGETKMQIFEDGQLNPALMVGAKASGSVLQGEAEAGFGTNQFGVYGKAEGDVLHAEAEATAGVGYIGTDKDGNAQYGAKAEASAMASIAQGEVKGGFTLWGIDIDVGAKGYAGAVGVEAGASITTDGVKADFSGAAVLGAGLEVSIDWSDAEWIEDGVDWIGDRAEDVGDFLYDAGDWVGDKAEDVGDFLFGWI